MRARWAALTVHQNEFIYLKARCTACGICLQQKDDICVFIVLGEDILAEEPFLFCGFSRDQSPLPVPCSLGGSGPLNKMVCHMYYMFYVVDNYSVTVVWTLTFVLFF